MIHPTPTCYMRGMLHALHAANQATETPQMYTDTSTDSRLLTSPDDQVSPSPSQVLMLSLAFGLDACYSLRNKMIDFAVRSSYSMLSCLTHPDTTPHVMGGFA